MIERDEPITVHPGEWFFGNEGQRVRTLVGSCIALTAWHPASRSGGLCHYLLPKSPRARDVDRTDTRYGIYALDTLYNAMLAVDKRVNEFELGLFGGSSMFKQRSNSSVGQLNTELALQWLEQRHLKVRHSDIGGKVSRTIILDLQTGALKLSLGEPLNSGGGTWQKLV